MEEEYLLFQVETYRCAVSIADEPYCFRAVQTIPLPAASSHFSGYINYHGIMLPVYDIRKKFQLPAKPLNATDSMIRMTVNSHTIIIVVDEVLSFITIPRSAIVPVPDYETSGLPLTGVFRLNGEPVYVLNLNELLTSDEAADFKTITNSHPV